VRSSATSRDTPGVNDGGGLEAEACKLGEAEGVEEADDDSFGKSGHGF
jgi:hypothetical protein